MLTTVSEVSFKMTEPNLVETVDRGHEAFLDKLGRHDASDSSFPYWLSSAAINLSLAVKNVELQGKLHHVDALAKAVKDGFDKVQEFLVHMPQEDRDRIEFGHACFKESFEGNSDESKMVKLTGATELMECKDDIAQEAMTAKETTAMAFGKEDTKCAICREAFKNPKILPCLHAFCMHCLEETDRKAKKNSGEVMPCKICGQEFKVPREGFYGLKKFEAVEKITEPEQVPCTYSTVSTCEVCAETYRLYDATEIPPAVAYCVECEQKLCDRCEQYHNRFKQLKLHKMQDLEDPKNYQAAFAHLTIEDKTAATSRKLYWKQEKRTFYRNFESLLTEEEELLNYFLPKKATSDDSHIGRDWKQRRTILSTKLETLVDVQNYILELLIPSETSPTGGWRQVAKDIGDKLKRQQQSWRKLKVQVLSELRESKPSRFRSRFSTSIDKVDLLLHEVQHLKRALKKSGDLSGKGDIFSELENLTVEESKEKPQSTDCRTVEKYFAPPEPPIHSSRWSYDIECELGLLDDLDSICYDDYNIARSRLSLEGTQKEDDVLKKLQEHQTPKDIREEYDVILKQKIEETQKEKDTINTLLEHGIPAVELPVKFRSNPVLIQTIRTKDAEERNKAIRGMAILDKELFVVSEKSSEIEVYDSVKFIFSRRWNLKGLTHPQDIVSCNRNKCLYIIDSKVIGQLKEILRVDPSGMLIKKWSTGDDFGWSLSVTDESNVILAAYDKDKLIEYSPDGQLIREINLPTFAGIRCPRHAIQLTNGHFVVSHGFGYFDPHQVIIVDANGKLNKSFGGKCGSTIVQMNCPLYLFVDGSGFVLVVDHGNNRVLLLDPELKYSKEFLSKEKHGLLFPQRILLDESNGQLFVADNDGKDGRIMIFQLKVTE